MNAIAGTIVSWNGDGFFTDNRCWDLRRSFLVFAPAVQCGMVFFCLHIDVSALEKIAGKKVGYLVLRAVSYL